MSENMFFFLFAYTLFKNFYSTCFYSMFNLKGRAAYISINLDSNKHRCTHYDVKIIFPVSMAHLYFHID